MRLKVLLTGTKGQIAREMIELARTQTDLNLVPVGLPGFDLARPETLRDPVMTARPDIIISVAAFTQVDACERDEALAMQINAKGPMVLARLAAELDIPILHVSTDYVFSGDKSTPYTEDDIPSPINAYGRSKLAGEIAVAAETKNSAIVRTSWVYSPYGQNFVKTMIQLAKDRDFVRVVNDQWGSPTAASELARILIGMARRLNMDTDPSLRGRFHAVAEGSTSWAGLAETLFVWARNRGAKSAEVEPIPSSAYPTPARRPANSRLDASRFKALYGLELAPWQELLKACLDQLIGPEIVPESEMTRKSI